MFSGITPWFNLFFAPIFGFSQGTRAVVSYNYASNKFSRIWKFTKIVLCVQMIYSLCIFIVISFAGQYMIGLFVNDTLPINDFKIYFIEYSTIFLLAPITYTALSVYQSLGQKNKSLFITTLRSWIAVIPTFYFAWAITWAIYTKGSHSAETFFAFMFIRDFISAAVSIFFARKTYHENIKILTQPDPKNHIDYQTLNFLTLIKSYKNSSRKLAKNILHYEKFLSARTEQKEVIL